ncbi:hypothetical protein GQ600_20417 [Phytophthora cactorum]|nr:hypothetical protein GQ600_20417 [Phytophthora cactorum]
MRLPASVFLQLLALLSSVTDAASAPTRRAYAGTLWDDAGATSACAQYVVATNPSTLTPMHATDCVGVMEGVARTCLRARSAGSATRSSCRTRSRSVTAETRKMPGLHGCHGRTNNFIIYDTDAYIVVCYGLYDGEYTSTEDLYDAAAATSACSPYSTSSSVLVSFDTPCSATDCINVLVQLAADLPDCLYDGANQKTELTDNLGVCTDTATEVDSHAQHASRSTASSTGCTTTEVKNMWDLYVSTATSDKCASESTINGYSIFIFTSCDSECADKVKDLAEALPNCYYEYEFMNKKQDVLAELDDCEESSSYHISVTIIPDSSIEFASSASSSESDSEPLLSGDRSIQLWIHQRLVLRIALRYRRLQLV